MYAVLPHTDQAVNKKLQADDVSLAYEQALRILTVFGHTTHIHACLLTCARALSVGSRRNSPDSKRDPAERSSPRLCTDSIVCLYLQHCRTCPRRRPRYANGLNLHVLTSTIHRFLLYRPRCVQRSPSAASFLSPRTTQSCQRYATCLDTHAVPCFLLCMSSSMPHALRTGWTQASWMHSFRRTCA